jgi:hypothetical protein
VGREKRGHRLRTAVEEISHNKMNQFGRSAVCGKPYAEFFNILVKKSSSAWIGTSCDV